MTQPQQHGGYRRPRNPAPVSGPGRLSRRTDGGPTQPIRDLPNPDYGEQKTFRDIQRAAPMAAGRELDISPVDLSGVVPFNAPTQRPGEPVTAGAPLGPGPGLDVLGQPLEDKTLQTLRGYLPGLELLANMPQASPAFRDFVRRVRALT